MSFYLYLLMQHKVTITGFPVSVLKRSRYRILRGDSIYRPYLYAAVCVSVCENKSPSGAIKLLVCFNWASFNIVLQRQSRVVSRISAGPTYSIEVSSCKDNFTTSHLDSLPQHFTWYLWRRHLVSCHLLTSWEYSAQLQTRY